MSQKQRIFDWVVAHLTHQAAPALVGDGCRYRTPGDVNVMRCAAGCLIDEQHYNPEIEGYPVDDLDIIDIIEMSAGIDVRDEQTVRLIRQLQTDHDSAGQTQENRHPTIHRWRHSLVEEMRKTAECYGLETSQLRYMEQRFQALEKQHAD